MRTAAHRELLFVGLGLVSAGAGQLAYGGAGTFGVALVGSAFMGMGLSFYFAPAMALIQRVAPERQRGRVTSVFGVLQEAVGLTTSLTLAAIVVLPPSRGCTAYLTGRDQLHAQFHGPHRRHTGGV